VRGAADVPHLAAQVVHPQRDAVGVGEERRRDLDLAPVDGRPDARPVRLARRDDLLTGALVRDDRRAGEQVVAVGVVPVVVGVDERAHRPVGDS
jgi:hypothetical protein